MELHCDFDAGSHSAFEVRENEVPFGRLSLVGLHLGMLYHVSEELVARGGLLESRVNGIATTHVPRRYRPVGATFALSSTYRQQQWDPTGELAE